MILHLLLVIVTRQTGRTCCSASFVVNVSTHTHMYYSRQFAVVFIYYLFLYLFIYLFIKQLRLIAVHVYSGKSVNLEARELHVA